MKKSLSAKTIVYPTPVFIVGTYDKAGKTKCDECGIGVSAVQKSALCCDFCKEGYVYVREEHRGRKAFTVNILLKPMSTVDHFGIASGAKKISFPQQNLLLLKRPRRCPLY